MNATARNWDAGLLVSGTACYLSQFVLMFRLYLTCRTFQTSFYKEYVVPRFKATLRTLQCQSL